MQKRQKVTVGRYLPMRITESVVAGMNNIYSNSIQDVERTVQLNFMVVQ